jgi:class 3 adenylate cyclase/predicted ATPase/ABC-type transport system involved in cytochrome c biogenesis ATPase subunit
MGVPCPECGFRNARDAAVCGGCGRTLDTDHAAVAERRQLTVFFADIVGSTALAESMDPEELRELYGEYQAACAEAFKRYAGHLAQHLGDGVLAYFGYPAAHEDDACRAVRSGLEILKRVQSIGRGADNLQIRIGIHTGLVVVGDVGTGSRREQLALGEAPNIAARLQSEAAPDTMVISDATRRLVGGLFDLEDLGSRTLKGLGRPMQLFRVLGSSGTTNRFHALAAGGGLTPLVGREAEGREFQAAWTEVSQGHGRTLLLRGEAGIGKSRLLEAARHAAGNRLHEVFEAQCSPYHVNSAFHPLIEMLERRMAIEKDLPAAEKLDLLEQFSAGRGAASDEATAALAELLAVPSGDRYPQALLEPAQRRQKMIQTLAGLLLHAVGGSPVLLLVEDLHWADPSTLELLGEIVARQVNLPVLAVFTTRPEFDAPWPAHSHRREIQVGALSPDDTRGLVAKVAGPKPLPLSLIEELVARTGGIPLFVEAVTRTVLEAGILRERDDRYELTGPLPSGLIPATVQDSLMGRIDRLGADRAVAQLAATIGREFTFDLLQNVLGKPTEALAHSLRHLVELELVSQSGIPPASTYVFKHALIQDAAYESLLRKTRQEYHSKIAEALVLRFPELAETTPALLARHYEGAGRIDDAIASWMRAGKQAQTHSALRECVAHMRKTIALIDALPESHPHRAAAALEAHSAMLPALQSTLGWGSRDSEEACIRVRDLCVQLNDGPGMLTAQWGLWGVYFVRGEIRRSIEAGRPVLEMTLATDNPAAHLVARHCVGYSRYYHGDFAEAREHAEKALEHYTPERERAIVTAGRMPSSFSCANFLTMSLWFLGYPDQAEQARLKSWAVIEALDIPACTALGLGDGLMIHYARRDLSAIGARVERLYALSTEGGLLLWAGQARIYRGWLQAMQGDPEAGLAEMKSGVEAYRLTGSGVQMPHWCLMTAEARWRAGRLEEATESISEGLATAEEHEERVYESELYRVRGEIQFEQGADADGEASLRRAIEVARAQNAKMVELRAALAFARLVRRESEARELLRPLDDWFLEGRDMPELREARTILGGNRANRQAAADN